MEKKMTIREAYAKARQEWGQYRASYRNMPSRGPEVVVRDSDSNVVETYPVEE